MVQPALGRGMLQKTPDTRHIAEGLPCASLRNTWNSSVGVKHSYTEATKHLRAGQVVTAEIGASGFRVPVIGAGRVYTAWIVDTDLYVHVLLLALPRRFVQAEIDRNRR